MTLQFEPTGMKLDVLHRSMSRQLIRRIEVRLTIHQLNVIYPNFFDVFRYLKLQCFALFSNIEFCFSRLNSQSEENAKLKSDLRMEVKYMSRYL